jgi:hypothetical protein
MGAVFGGENLVWRDSANGGPLFAHSRSLIQRSSADKGGEAGKPSAVAVVLGAFAAGFRSLTRQVFDVHAFSCARWAIIAHG